MLMICLENDTDLKEPHFKNQDPRYFNKENVEEILFFKLWMIMRVAHALQQPYSHRLKGNVVEKRHRWWKKTFFLGW